MASPTFPVNAHRFNPYLTFKFQVVIEGKPVAGLRKMTALKRKTETVKWRGAGDPSVERSLVGKTSYEPVTLEGGLTHDTVFEEWANLVFNFEGDGAVSLAKYRRDVIITVMNLAGQPAIGYKLFRAWVSDFQALPDLDAGTNAVGIQSITLQHEGWQRDLAVTEPTEE